MTRKLVVVDVETGSLDCRRGAICSVAVGVLDRNLDLISCFYRTVKDVEGKEYRPDAMEVNGLDPEALQRDGMPVERVLALLGRALDGAVFVAQNATFDIRFLEERGIYIREYICTLALARKAWPKERHSLKEIAGRLGFTALVAHHALNDVLMTVEVLNHFAEMEMFKPIESCIRRYEPKT